MIRDKSGLSGDGRFGRRAMAGKKGIVNAAAPTDAPKGSLRLLDTL
ncbi:MAG: hypothetical protein ACHQ0J_15015 [Candidatus Dormibacterales bacterium]